MTERDQASDTTVAGRTAREVEEAKKLAASWREQEEKPVESEIQL